MMTMVEESSLDMGSGNIGGSALNSPTTVIVPEDLVTEIETDEER